MYRTSGKIYYNFMDIWLEQFIIQFYNTVCKERTIMFQIRQILLLLQVIFWSVSFVNYIAFYSYFSKYMEG